MHTSSMKRMEWFADKYLRGKRGVSVLDVGSYNVNGCYKEIFVSRGCKYIGLDMEEGPNVDYVPEQVYEWKELEDDQFDVVVSGQALEHIEFFWVTVSEMIRVTKKNGIICIIAPNGFEEHRYPVDCWRFFTDGMVALGRFNKLNIINAHTNCAPTLEDHEWYSKDCADSMLIAEKPYSGKTQTADLKNYRCIPSDLKVINGNMMSYNEYKLSKVDENQKLNSEACEGNKETYTKKLKKKTKKIKELLQKIFRNQENR